MRKAHFQDPTIVIYTSTFCHICYTSTFCHISGGTKKTGMCYPKLQSNMENMDWWKRYTASTFYQSLNTVYSCTRYQFRNPPSIWCNLCGLGKTYFFYLLWHQCSDAFNHMKYADANRGSRSLNENTNLCLSASECSLWRYYTQTISPLYILNQH